MKEATPRAGDADALMFFSGLTDEVLAALPPDLQEWMRAIVQRRRGGSPLGELHDDVVEFVHAVMRHLS